MAISIEVVPQTFNPVYNDIVFVVDSTNKTRCSMRYVCYVYVNGTQVVALKLFPNDTNGRATFRLNKVLENYVRHDRHDNLTSVATNPSSVCIFGCVFGEETDGTNDCTGGAFTIDPASLLASDIYTAEVADVPSGTYEQSFQAWNAVQQYPEFVNYDYLDFMPSRDLTQPGQELVYNGGFAFGGGNWPNFVADGFGNGFGMASGTLIFLSATNAGYSNGVVSTLNALTPGVSYDFSFTIGVGSFGGTPTTMGALLLGGDPVWLDLNLGFGTHNISGTGVCGLFGSGLITFLLAMDDDGFAIIDNLSIKESATQPGTTWQERRLLTNFPENGTIPVHPGEDCYMSWLQFKQIDQLDLFNPRWYEPTDVRYTGYDEAGNVVWGPEYLSLSTNQLIDLGSPNYPYDQVGKFMITAAVGPRNLAGYFPRMLTEDTAYYDVVLVKRIQIGNGPVYSEAVISQAMRYSFFPQPTRFQTHRLEWLGRLGNMESFSFRLRDNRSVTNDPTEYTKIIPEYNGVTFGYQLGDRGRTVINNVVQEKLSVLSEYVDTDVAAWLEELFTATEVVEQTLANIKCFDATGADTFCLRRPHGIELGDSVTVSSLTNLLDPSSVVTQVLTVSDMVESQASPPNGVVYDCITLNDPFTNQAGPHVLQVNEELGKLPCVITSREFKTRDKRGKERNISYTIEYERAYPIIVQRG